MLFPSSTTLFPSNSHVCNLQIFVQCCLLRGALLDLIIQNHDSLEFPIHFIWLSWSPQLLSRSDTLCICLFVCLLLVLSNIYVKHTAELYFPAFMPYNGVRPSD